MTDKPDLAALFGAADTDSFLGLEKSDPFGEITASSAFLGVPCATPYRSVGAYARNGPQSVRDAAASLTSNLDRYNFDLDGVTFPAGCLAAVDCGDVGWDEQDFASNRAGIKQAVSALCRQNVIPICVGGDDSIPIPMIEALGEASDKKFTILQIDAHIDWRDSHMDERYGLSSTMRRASEMAHISTIIQVGARGIGSAHPDDYRDALEWGVQFFSAQHIHENGIAQVTDSIEPDCNLIICFDIDALDPAFTPNTIGRAPGGLTYTQALSLLKAAAGKSKICAVDFAEIMPEVDIDGIGALTVSRLITAVMGLIARQQLV